MSNKRRREQPTVDAELVEIFEDLASENEEIRLKAAKTLLLKALPGADTSSEQLIKILRRLIRGLCSGRKAARLGFSVALTELLVQILGPHGKEFPDLNLGVAELIKILEEQTNVGGSVSGQEERDHHFGRLFGAEAFIKSHVLFRDDTAIDCWAQVLDIIYSLAIKKPWLREECGWILYEATQSLSVHTFDLKYAQLIIDKLHAAGLARTPEGLAVWIATQSLFPLVNLPLDVWRGEDPLYKTEKTKLAQLLKESSVTDSTRNGSDVKAPSKGIWNSKLHFAWDVVLAALLDIHSQPAVKRTKPSKRLNFVDFWHEAVDNSLFIASSSDERKYWGFLLFQRMFRDAPEHLLPVLFSKNLMRCLMNQLSSPERYLHRIAEKTLKVVVAKVEAHPQLVVSALNGLLGPNGETHFDQITKTKTVENLLTQVNDKTLRELLPVFDKAILRPEVKDEKAAASRRQMIADQLVSVVRSRQIALEETNPAVHESFASIKQILAMFVKYAYFTVEEAHNGKHSVPEPPVSKASQEMFRSRITSCLTHVIAKAVDPSHSAYDVVCIIRYQEGLDNGQQIIFDADHSIRKVIRKSWKTLDKVHSKAKSAKAQKRSYLRAFKLLYSLTILQVYNGDADAVNVLDDLKDCYGTLVKHNAKGELGGSELLVEVLLSFVSKPSLLYRRLAQQVFSAFAPDVNAMGLQSMIRVLETKESMLGQEEMFDHEDEEDQDDANSNDNEPFDIEEIDMLDANAMSSPIHNNAEPGTSNTPSNSNSDSDLETSNDELSAFDAKLAEALRTQPPNRSSNSPHPADSDSDMSSTQMLALDTHLASIFRARKSQSTPKSRQKSAKETITSFKCRVLDLLEIYIKHQHANPLALSLLLPVLTLLTSTTSTLVSTKASAIMREYSRLCKGKVVPAVTDAEPIFDLLSKVHAEAMKGGSNAHASACSQASLLLVKTLAARGRQNLKRVVAVYAATQERMLFEGASCGVRMSFFTDWLNWCATARK